MILKIIATGQTGTPGELFPQTSFSGGTPSAEWRLEHGVEDAYPPVLATPWPPFDPMTQKAQALAPAVVDGVLSQQWEIVALDADTVATKQAEVKARDVAQVQADLAALDLKSIRSLREYIAAKPDASSFIKQHETDAANLRAKLK